MTLAPFPGSWFSLFFTTHQFRNGLLGKNLPRSISPWKFPFPFLHPHSHSLYPRSMCKNGRRWDFPRCTFWRRHSGDGLAAENTLYSVYLERDLLRSIQWLTESLRRLGVWGQLSKAILQNRNTKLATESSIIRMLLSKLEAIAIAAGSRTTLHCHSQEISTIRAHSQETNVP